MASGFSSRRKEIGFRGFVIFDLPGEAPCQRFFVHGSPVKNEKHIYPQNNRKEEKLLSCGINEVLPLLWRSYSALPC